MTLDEKLQVLERHVEVLRAAANLAFKGIAPWELPAAAVEKTTHALQAVRIAIHRAVKKRRSSP